jgi:hypothetical protein
MKPSENLLEFKHNQIIKEFKSDLKELYKRVKYSLKINPHNNFMGNARQYINTFKLNDKIREKIISKWDFIK